MSAEKEWSYNADFNSLHYGPREQWNQLGKSITYFNFFTLLDACYLGIPCLPGDFTWRTETEFEFRNHLYGGMRFRGRVLRTDGANPLELEYENRDRRTPLKYRVVYHYQSPGTFPPVRFDVFETRKKWSEETRYRLHQLELGIDPAAEQGYHFARFLGTNQISEMRYHSNGVRYIVYPDHTMQPYQWSTPPVPVASTRWAASAALGAAVLGLVAIVIFRYCGKTKHKPTERQTP